MTGEFEYKGKRYAYKSLGDGSWTSECASLELMKVLRNYFISSGKMVEGGFWPGSRFGWAWTSDVGSDGYRILFYSYGNTDNVNGNCCFARFAVISQDAERKNF